MLWLNACVISMLTVAAAAVQPSDARELKGFVLSIDDTKLVVSNIRVGPAGGGQTFVMTAPKEGGGQPNWVAADPKAAGDGQKGAKVKMMTTAGDAPLEITEFALAKGAIKAADFPAGTAIVVTYREVEGKKIFSKAEPPKKP
jgi:hypothetical protein